MASQWLLHLSPPHTLKTVPIRKQGESHLVNFFFFFLAWKDKLFLSMTIFSVEEITGLWNPRLDEFCPWGLALPPPGLLSILCVGARPSELQRPDGPERNPPEPK